MLFASSEFLISYKSGLDSFDSICWAPMRALFLFSLGEMKLVRNDVVRIGRSDKLTPVRT
jgi:hypothetical protein